MAGRGNGEVSRVSGMQRGGHACAGAGSWRQLYKSPVPQQCPEGQAGCPEQPPGDSITSDWKTQR